jgi:hypothetical protein
MQQPFDGEETGIVTQENAALEQRPQSLTERMQDIMNATAMLVTAQKQLIETAVKMTSPADWINMGGNPYLGEPGATRVASMLPIDTKIVGDPKRHNALDDEGSYYIYVCTARASWRTGLGSSEALGTCSSRDKFYSMRQGERIPQSEVDETNIIKKCGTNGRANAIKGLLGLKKPSWEDLERIAGITKEKVQTVEYTSKKPEDENPEQADKTRTEIRRMIMEMCKDDEGEAAKYLETMTTFKGKEGNTVKGKKSVKHLSERQAKVIYGKVKDQHEKWRKTQGKAQGREKAPPLSLEDEFEQNLEGLS